MGSIHDLRQGDLLSPLLIILVIDPLHRLGMKKIGISSDPYLISNQSGPDFSIFIK